MDKEMKLVIIMYALFSVVLLAMLYRVAEYHTEIEELTRQLSECHATACEVCYGK